MSYEEFNRLFCKGMFKVALISTIDNLKNVGSKEALDEERDQGYLEEMPLSLKIERYQRARILDGLDPKTDKKKQAEILKVLQSLKFIQKYDEVPDGVIPLLRNRNYDEFIKDPLGQKIIEKFHKATEKNNDFAAKIQFINDTMNRH
jgi:hypothetical protein